MVMPSGIEHCSESEHNAWADVKPVVYFGVDVGGTVGVSVKQAGLGVAVDGTRLT